MRLVKIDNLQEGMKLGRTIYGPNNEVFLNRGTTIKSTYISSLRRLNYSSIYIVDALSEGIDIPEAVTPEIRNNAERAIKNAFQQTLHSGQAKMQFSGIPEAVSDIVEQILGNSETIDNLTNLKTFDGYTFQHSVNTCIISALMGRKLDMKKDEIKTLGISAALHDIGKMVIPKRIIVKPSNLTTDEYDIVKLHTIYGRDLIHETMIFSPEVSTAVAQHHDRADGLGYMEGLENGEICVFAKIIALSDVYDAITSERSYRNAMQTFEAYEYVMSNMGTQFDADITKIFLKNIAPFPVGTCVRLSSGEIGMVISNNEDLMMRPCIRLANNKGILDLSSIDDSLHITVTEVIG